MRYFRKVLSKIILTIAVTLLSLATVETAMAYTVTKGPIFNNPYSTTTSTKWALIKQVNDAIDNTASGQTIRIAVYSFTRETTIEKLQKAYARGVKVQIITDDHLYDNLKSEDPEDAAASAEAYRRISILKNLLGTNISAGSFVKICKNGCMSTSTASGMHAKIYQFSKTGDSTFVTMISSGNLTSSEAWNNTYTFADRKDVYDDLGRYFYAMSKEPDGGDWYQNNAYGTNDLYRIYTFPRLGASSDLSLDMYYTMLDNVTCMNGTTPTRIDVAMFSFTDSRIEVAKKLNSLSNKGCKVRVLLHPSKDSTGTYQNIATLRALINDSKIEVRHEDGYMMHHKYIIIKGWYGVNKTASITFTGSANMTGSGLSLNNESIIRTIVSTHYDKYLSNYNLIWGKSHRIYFADVN